MKNKDIFFLLLLFIFVSNCLQSQTFKIYDFDKSDYPPYLKVKFIALDIDNNSYSGLSEADFEIKENGKQKTVTLVNCPQSSIKTISSVLTIDISGSMRWDNNLSMAKAAAKTWIDGLPDNGSECAITSYNKLNFENHDWSTDKNSLHRAIDRMKPGGGTNYDEGLLGYPAGGIEKAKSGKHGKKVVVFLTDGLGDGTEAAIIQTAIDNNVTVYCVTVRMPAPAILKNISHQTGGAFFENVTSTARLLDIYKSILEAETKEPCILQWLSDGCGGNQEVVITINRNGLADTLNYVATGSTTAYLELSPSILDFGMGTIGSPKVDSVTITAKNGDVKISGAETNNSVFTIDNPSIIPTTLSEDSTITILISYSPLTNEFSTGKLILQSDACSGDTLLMNGSINNELVVIQPNGGELLEQCKDTLIRWGNVLPTDTVVIDYSIDNGENWDTITTEGVGLSHLWRIPEDVESSECLMRVTLKHQPEPCICEDGEIKIGVQKWMVCNLDVTHYRNGDSIPHVQDSAEWANADYGAWCYYDNDSTNGQCYGKLYNWYAVNDPRGLAPRGWHIPADNEWKTLEMELGMSLDEANSTGWRGDNEGSQLAGNSDLWESGSLKENINFGSSDFQAIPGGYRSFSGNFENMGIYSHLWLASECNNKTSGWLRYFHKDESKIYRECSPKNGGFSVRCVRDIYIKICEQTWTSQNLAVDTYSNGDPIQQVTDPSVWASLNEGAWCYYNDDQSNDTIYGKLYNWYAVNDPRGLAPYGWHVATDDEWKQIEVCLGMSENEANASGWRGDDEGSQLSDNNDLWIDGSLKNNSAFGTSGFSGFPGGIRNLSGTFGDIANHAHWWTSSEYDATFGWGRYLSYDNSKINRDGYHKETGYSVRCTKNNYTHLCNSTWTAKNLDVTHYRNGDAITQCTTQIQWENVTDSEEGAWCYYGFDEEKGKVYGKLYNWYSVNDPRGLAPYGWHVATDVDWQEMEMCLGMSQSDIGNTGYRGTNENIGGKLKEIETRFWHVPNEGATNGSEFSGLPGGCITNLGVPSFEGENGYFWTSDSKTVDHAWCRVIEHDTSAIWRDGGNKKYGHYVRCVKNEYTELCKVTWTSKNLDVETYRNGTEIRHAETIEEWKDAISKQEGAWCYYDNDSINGKIYGKLYNWYAVKDNRGLAPHGWHIPSDEEWKDLEVCIDMTQGQADAVGWRGTMGGKLKDTELFFWNQPNSGATNDSEFNAIAGGYLRDSSFIAKGTGVYWWTSSASSLGGWYRGLANYNSQIYRQDFDNSGWGMYVRIVRGDTVNICNQTWMVPNLNVDHYRNGDSIPEVRDASRWDTLTTGAWCYSNNDKSNDADYGKLYNWYAVNDPRGLAPEGWYIAYDEDWKELEMCLGMSVAEADEGSYRGEADSVGGKLKEEGTEHWLNPNTGATNSSGFTALDGGVRGENGTFASAGAGYGYWWTASEINSSSSYFRGLDYYHESIYRANYTKGSALSVRLLKGNEVQICDQRWSNKNLDVETYRNGDPIPQVTDPTDWSNLTTGAWCYYNNNDSLGNIYGKLYNWYAVNDPRGLAPEGWHVPSDDEWKEMEICLGMSSLSVDSSGFRGSDEGGKLKEIGETHWNSTNFGATNESKFLALAGGFCGSNGNFGSLGTDGYWWTSTDTLNIYASLRNLRNSHSTISRGINSKLTGKSVRLVKGDWIQICDQVWTTKNLNVEYYRNGEPIRHCTNATEWQDANSKGEGAWCYYGFNESNKETYGKLYNWYAVNSDSILAPEGWHVPTDEEWKELEMCLGMSQEDADKFDLTRGTDQGSQLAGYYHLWFDEILRNNSNFSKSLFFAKPGSYITNEGNGSSLGNSGFWWTSSRFDVQHAWGRYLHFNITHCGRSYYSKDWGFSIRLVKDQ